MAIFRISLHGAYRFCGVICVFLFSFGSSVEKKHKWLSRSAHNHSASMNPFACSIVVIWLQNFDVSSASVLLCSSISLSSSMYWSQYPFTRYTQRNEIDTWPMTNEMKWNNEPNNTHSIEWCNSTAMNQSISHRWQSKHPNFPTNKPNILKVVIVYSWWLFI